jgi:hypothetical protein
VIRLLCVALVLCASACTEEDGWTVTVYYTAVAEYHGGTAERVRGCPRFDCDGTVSEDLGAYPATFVRAVHDEGTGRISAGRYLNWSVDVGYWLDTAPRDSAGGALEPWRSAAADADVLEAGTRFTITSCGDGPSDEVCDRMRAAEWTVRDEFTPGLGGDRHVEVYIGEETGPEFTGSDWYTTLTHATLKVL